MKPHAAAVALSSSSSSSWSAIADAAQAPTRQRQPLPFAWPLTNSPLHATGYNALQRPGFRVQPVGGAVEEAECAAAVGAAAAPIACSESKNHVRTGCCSSGCSHAPEYHPPSCSTKACPGFNIANAGAVTVPLLMLACNRQPLPHVTDTRPCSSPLRHSPASEYDAGSGRPSTTNTP
jgi:hypothetical protein